MKFAVRLSLQVVSCCSAEATRFDAMIAGQKASIFVRDLISSFGLMVVESWWTRFFWVDDDDAEEEVDCQFCQVGLAVTGWVCLHVDLVQADESPKKRGRSSISVLLLAFDDSCRCRLLHCLFTWEDRHQESAV